jgi:FMN-dependent oxidoreductase (nitrilotriacetate monooxygenase family)
MTQRKMHLGLSIRALGYAQAPWRHPDVKSDGQIDYDSFLRVAKAAEAAKFDMIFFADNVGYIGGDNPAGSIAYTNRVVELDPLILLSALAANTRHLGLVATASTTFNDPYQIARRFSSLDHVSGGRAAWNVVTSFNDAEAKNFSLEQMPPYEERHERAEEFVQVVEGLWDGWETDALVLDKASGRFVDPDRMHVLNHRGRFFQVRGPLTCPRSPQGRPVLVQAGDGEPARRIAASHADLVYTAAVSLQAARDYATSLRGMLEEKGRDPASVRIMPAATVFVGRTRAEAEGKYEMMQDLVHEQTGLALVYSRMGDLSDHPLDGPVPEPIYSNSMMQSGARRFYDMARRDNLTIRQLGRRLGAGTWGRPPVMGTARDVADHMEEWFTAGVADGFNLTPGYLPQQIEDFAELVVPELQRRGLFRTEYQGPTLRDQLGLPKHRGPWDLAREKAAAPAA